MTIVLGVQDTNNDLKGRKLEKISVWYYLFASFFRWILLAGFLVLPNAFGKLEEIQTNSAELKKVVYDIRNIPLYVSFLPLIPLLPYS